VGRLLKESDSRARLRRGAERVLQHAVASRRVGTDSHDSVRRSLRALCRAARSHGLYAEQLVVLCKDAWRTLPQARELPPETGTGLLKGVISLCIDEFYRTDGADVAPSNLSSDAPVPDSSLSFMLGPLS
jgi:hypothetical protein